MIVDSQGWLVPEAHEPTEVVRIPTVRTFVLSTPQPLGIVWHWTAGRGDPDDQGTPYAENLANSIRTYERGKDRAASWHMLIARNGRIYQSAPLSVGTWHVGKGGEIAGKWRKNINRVTIGCELENAGRLRRLDAEYYCWPYWRNPRAPRKDRKPEEGCRMDPDRVIVLGGNAFEAYTEAQQTTAYILLKALVTRFDWPREDCLYGHVDFDPGRKEDPGPHWQRIIFPVVLDAIFRPEETWVPVFEGEKDAT